MVNGLFHVQQGSHMALCRASFEDLGPIKVSRYIAYPVGLIVSEKHLTNSAVIKLLSIDILQI